MRDLLESWADALPELREQAAGDGAWHALGGLGGAAPVMPRQIIQAGANYRTHVIDLAVKHADLSDGRTKPRSGPKSQP